VYEISLTVAACLRAGTRVDVAWAVETHGFSARDHTDALALTPGGGRVGSVLSGSLNDQLADRSAEGVTNRLVDLHVGDLDASLAGLSCGGDARCLLIAADCLPAELWERLGAREPACVLTRIDGDRVVGTSLFTAGTIADAPEHAVQMFGRATSGTEITADGVITVLWPVPKLVVVGAGAIAEALDAAAQLLGWHPQLVTDVNTSTGLINGLATLDMLVVLSHDHDVAGPALEAALSSDVGYIGALGSRKTQRARAQWLADRGVTDLTAIHGPAGLDIGASSPAEIAVSILAEALATKSGTAPISLRDRGGSIH
jgi:xanthine dehydrogenase accessory factor